MITIIFIIIAIMMSILATQLGTDHFTDVFNVCKCFSLRKTEAKPMIMMILAFALFSTEFSIFFYNLLKKLQQNLDTVSKTTVFHLCVAVNDFKRDLFGVGAPVVNFFLQFFPPSDRNHNSFPQKTNIFLCGDMICLSFENVHFDLHAKYIVQLYRQACPHPSPTFNVFLLFAHRNTYLINLPRS